MERLSGLDSAFLSFETPAMHLHVAIAAVVDPSTMPGGYSFDRLKAFITGRTAGQPVFRRRVVEVPFGLNHPVWVDDPNLDLGRQIHRHVLPSPGGPRELAALTGRIAGVPLDRSRPLWEIHVVEGLHDGNVALIGKIHHAAVDGVSGADLFVHLLDLAPHAPSEAPSDGPHDGSGDATAARPPVHAGADARVPSHPELVGHALLSQARRAVELPGLLGRTVRTATQLVNRHRDPQAAVGAVPLRAPRTPWSAAISPERSVAFARVGLGEVRHVRRAFGVTVNDVVLAVTSGALRRYLAERAALPREPLVGLCPVSVRTADERGRCDNRVSAMFVHLHTDVADVAERVRAIARAAAGAKQDHSTVGDRFVQSWAEHAAPGAFALATRLYSRLRLADRHPPIYNLVVSNVPGPDFPLYLDGARLVAAYPMGPVAEGAGLNVTVLSYLDNVDIGFLADAELVPDVWDLARHVDEAMAELLAAAGRHADDAATHADDAAGPRGSAAGERVTPPRGAGAGERATARDAGAEQAPDERSPARRRRRSTPVLAGAATGERA